VSGPSEANWLLQVRRPPLPLLDRRPAAWVTVDHPVTLPAGIDEAERHSACGKDARLLLHGAVYYFVSGAASTGELRLPGVRR
jgi:hypothetical protein